MVILETVTLLAGIGLSSVSVTDAPMESMEQCEAYLAAQAQRYQIFLPKHSTQFELSYRKLGSDFTVTRTCISY